MNEQERFWSGKFGNEYISRNRSSKLLSSNVALFAKILSGKRVYSAIEFGANIGLNLQAIHTLLPDCVLTGIEINKTAAQELSGIEYVNAVNKSISGFEVTDMYDLSFAKGTLIHLNPNDLPLAYSKLFDSSNRYICIIEYYNPTPVSVAYRGRRDKLFKRDFAGEFIDTHANKVQLVDYGFVYHRDAPFAQDDLTWFLFEKQECT